MLAKRQYKSKIVRRYTKKIEQNTQNRKHPQFAVLNKSVQLILAQQNAKSVGHDRNFLSLCACVLYRITGLKVQPFLTPPVILFFYQTRLGCSLRTQNSSVPYILFNRSANRNACPGAV